ncbi:MAG TPA: GNAT family N-acetyltransferase [Gaiellales bacterium]|jgi:ribosomal protein S18 acetylase RimI-like enzyme
MTHIDPAVAGDAAAVTACVRAAYAEHVAAIGREPAPMAADYARLIAEGAVWVARDGARIVGVLVVRPRPPELLLENVAVAPDRRGQGLGRTLIACAEEHARQAGFEAVALYTNARMTANLRLYPALGYRETGRATEEGFPRVHYRKGVR